MIEGRSTGVDPECLQVRPVPAVFLRFESPRLRVALPYSSLLWVELALNEEQLDLTFATHRVTIRGVRLARIFLAISEGTATQVAITRKQFPAGATLAPGVPLVGEIRVEPIDRDGPDSR